MLIGFNGWVFGKVVMDNGCGVLFGNLYFFWMSINCFYQIYLIVFGKLNVMGVLIVVFFVVSIGFNKDVVWMYIVFIGCCFMLFELKFVEGDLIIYLIDGKLYKMIICMVVFDVKLLDGCIEYCIYIFYNMVYGFVLLMFVGGMLWIMQKVYMLCDVNCNNMCFIDMWLYIVQVKDVVGIWQVIGNFGIFWVNMIVIDCNGCVLFVDVLIMLDVLVEVFKCCVLFLLVDKFFKGVGLVLFDGLCSVCNWQVDLILFVLGLVVFVCMLVFECDDYVVNSNDSLWLSNLVQKLMGFLLVMGLIDVL